MNFTRIDPEALKKAIEEAAGKMDEVFALLAPYLVLLSDVDREKVQRCSLPLSEVHFP